MLWIMPVTAMDYINNFRWLWINQNWKVIEIPVQKFGMPMPNSFLGILSASFNDLSWPSMWGCDPKHLRGYGYYLKRLTHEFGKPRSDFFPEILSASSYFKDNYPWSPQKWGRNPQKLIGCPTSVTNMSKFDNPRPYTFLEIRSALWFRCRLTTS